MFKANTYVLQFLGIFYLQTEIAHDVRVFLFCFFFYSEKEKQQIASECLFLIKFNIMFLEDICDWTSIVLEGK